VTRALPVWVAALTAGCSLVIGDIDLPPIQVEPTDEGVELDVGADAGRPDAARDAAPPDAGWDAGPDAGEPDAAPDAAPPPDLGLDAAWPDLGPDAAPDAAPDQGPPAVPFEPRDVAGRWHLYGVATAEPLEALLIVGADGSPGFSALDGTQLGVVPTLTPDAADPRRAALGLPGYLDDPLIGALDPITGFGVLVQQPPAGAPRQLVIAVRVGDAGLPSNALYVHAGLEPLGVGEYGAIARLGNAFRESGPLTTTGEQLPDRTLVATASGERFALVDVEGNERVLSTNGRAAVGTFDAVAQIEGVAFAWSPFALDADLAPATLFCAGAHLDADALVVQGRWAEILADGRTLRWDDGRAATLVRNGGLINLETERNFFGLPDGIAMTDPDRRVLVLLPVQPARQQVDWGFGACVSLEPVIR
jgi:hypothetical protein